MDINVYKKYFYWKNTTLNDKHLQNNIATLQSQVYKGNLENISMQYKDIALFMIVQHILDYKAKVYNPQFVKTFEDSS